MDFFNVMIARMNGERIEEEFPCYADLVQRGIAGFVIFGGEITAVRSAIFRLQAMASRPLIIASDMEQGTGQWLQGGTTFPPAMGMTIAERSTAGLARRVYTHTAREAAYAGVNTIFAPVLDIHTNPDNPIISTRAFGTDAATVTRMGALYIDSMQAEGIATCAKHFPGHGDTSVDSHVALPRLAFSLDELRAHEFMPFRAAVNTAVPMFMLAHMLVDAIDPTAPTSLSKPCVDILRGELGFTGLILTDALDMGALYSGQLTETGCAYAALRAGVDILLHPRAPIALSEGLSSLRDSIPDFPDLSARIRRINELRDSLSSQPSDNFPEGGETLANETFNAALVCSGPPPSLPPAPTVLCLGEPAPQMLQQWIRESFGNQARILSQNEHSAPDVVLAFASVRAYRGQVLRDVKQALSRLTVAPRLAVSFGPPELLNALPASLPEYCCRITLWHDCAAARRALQTCLHHPSR